MVGMYVSVNTGNQMIKSLDYKFLYRRLMKFAHRHDWHKMERNPYIEPGKVHLWCHWCGLRSVEVVKPLPLEEVVNERSKIECCR
jgi:hypothetical protein